MRIDCNKVNHIKNLKNIFGSIEKESSEYNFDKYTDYYEKEMGKGLIKKIVIFKKIVNEENLNVELSDSRFAYHINSAGINKARGFEEVMKRLRISADDVIAIGDSVTDIPLFKVAKTSVALGNASEFVQSNATMTVSAKAGDGVIEALDKLAPILSEL